MRHTYDGSWSIAWYHSSSLGQSLAPLGLRLACKHGSWTAYRSNNGAQIISAADRAAPQKNGPDVWWPSNSSTLSRNVSNVDRGKASSRYPSSWQNSQAAREDSLAAVVGTDSPNALAMALTSSELQDGWPSESIGGHSFEESGKVSSNWWLNFKLDVSAAPQSSVSSFSPENKCSCGRARLLKHSGRPSSSLWMLPSYVSPTAWTRKVSYEYPLIPTQTIT